MRAGRLVVIVFVLAACSGEAPERPAHPGRRHLVAVATFQTAEGPVRTTFLEVADTAAERVRGLMGRSALPANGGMAFLFPEQTRTPFWMKDTLVSLSVAVWGADGRVVDILDMTPCHADPCAPYVPRADYRSALEMRRGWFSNHGVEIGDRVELHVATE